MDVCVCVCVCGLLEGCEGELSLRRGVCRDVWVC